MKVILDSHKNYSRYDNILYCEDEPIVKFIKDRFTDWGLKSPTKSNLSKQGISYMQKYISMFPQNCCIMSQNIEAKKYDGKIKKFFFDVETTGTKSNLHSIHQLSFVIEIDDEVVEDVNLFIRPHPKAIIEQEALNVSKVTVEQIMQYTPMEDQFKILVETLKKYVDPFGKGDKMFLIGFKNASFDDDFIKKYFDLMGSKFFLYFYASSIDVSCLAAQYLMNTRSSMPSFKLQRVAKTIGIDVDDSKLHDAGYDVYLTRLVYKTVSKFEQNIF